MDRTLHIRHSRAGGNPQAAAWLPFESQSKSRIALHCKAFREEWLQSINPAEPNLSPWQRSLAHNGVYQEPREVVEYQMEKRNEYLEQLRKENKILT